MNDKQIYSKNERAEKVVGLRDLKGGTIIIDFPCELGYICPLCKNEQWDQRLEWSEYNGFIYCSVCNKDFPSVLCQPDIDKAIKTYLDCIEDAQTKKKR